MTAPEVPGYHDLTLIGRGARSTVYRAQHRRFNRVVAVKVLHVQAGDPAQLPDEQELETTVLLSSNHPHLVRILDSGVTDVGRPYIVMEYCSAGSYRQILEAEGPLPIEAVVEVGEAIAEALQAAHDAGLVHGAVTPSNILRVAFSPALADFPVARVRADPAVEPPEEALRHVAPEVLDGGEPTPAADLYALASTLWYLLTGWSPIDAAGAGSRAALADLVRTTPLPALLRPDVPSWLRLELERALQPEPDRRHPDAAAFAAILRHMSGGDAPTSPAGPPHPVVAPVPDAPGLDTPPSVPARRPGLNDPTEEGPMIRNRIGAPTIDVLDDDEPVWPGAGPPAGGPDRHVPPHAEVLDFPMPPRSTEPPADHPPPGPGYEFETVEQPRGSEAYDAGFNPFADGGDWPDERRPRRTWMVVAAVAVALAACGLGVSRFVGGDGQPPAGTQGQTQGQTQQAPPDGTLPSGAEALRSTTEGAPRDLKLVDEGASITLSWTDATAGAAQFAVLGGPRGAEVKVQKILDAGTTKLTLQGLNTSQDYCYRVFAVVGAGVYAPSSQVCTKRS